MKTKLQLLLVTLGLAAVSAAAQVPGIISHQGKVTVNGTNYTGSGQFKFALVDAAGTNTYWSNDGSSSGGLEPTSAVTLSTARGVFSVNLGDTNVVNMTQAIPADAFTNSAVYLRTWFNDGVDGSQLLTPDRQITSVGYALVAANFTGTLSLAQLPTGVVTNNETDVNLTGTFTGNGADSFSGSFNGDGSGLTGLDAGQLTGTVPLAQLPPDVLFNNASGVNLTGTFTGSFNGDGSGLTGLDATQLTGTVPLAQLPPGVLINGSGASGPNSIALGDTTANGYDSIAMGDGTTASGGLSTAMGVFTTASGFASTAMGNHAQATNDYSFVWADGQGEDFTSTTNNEFSVRAGGGVRLVTGGAGLTVDGQRVLTNLNAAQLTGTVPLAQLPPGVLINGSGASGPNSIALGDTTANGYDSIAMGDGTTASGGLSTAMGVFTTASGFASTAMGNHAQATNDYSFVWADGQSGIFTSTTNNEFSVRAGGGVRFVTGGAGVTVDGQPLLTNLNAAQLTGTIPLAQLPPGVLTNNASGVTLSGTFTGNGSGLTGLNGQNLVNGVPLAQLPAGVLTNGSGASAQYSTALGVYTSASGTASTAMGDSTTASGGLSTAMGVFTTASGFASTAMGNHAQATNDYSFVWADGQGEDFTSTTNNEFSVRAGGGVRFVTGGAGVTVDGQPLLTNLNAAQLTGTIPLAQLPAGVLTNNASGVSLSGTFIGNGSGLTSLNGQNLVNGVPLAQLPASVLTNGSGASGYASTALGDNTTANGIASTALGNSTLASGYASTAMGRSTTASGNDSTAMGVATVASGNASTALGYGTKASGPDSTALGLGTTASSYASTALGSSTTASGWASTAMGNYAQATNDYSFVWADGQGEYFTSTTNNEFSVRAGGGVRFVTDGAGVTVDGQPLLTNLNAAQLTGTIPLAQLPASVLLNGASGVSLSGTFTGNGSGLTGLNAANLTGTMGVAQLPAAVVTNGASGVSIAGTFSGNGNGLTNLNAQNLVNRVPLAQLPAGVLTNGSGASGLNSIALGYSTTASGTYSFALGGLTEASGAYSTALGFFSRATNFDSTAMGYSTMASGYYSTAMGYGTMASGYDSTAMGYGTTASGYDSTAMGYGTTASGYDSTAMGYDAQAINDYSFVWADGQSALFTSTTTNEFSVRAGGGVRFVTGGAGLTVDGQRVLANGASGGGVNYVPKFTASGTVTNSALISDANGRVGIMTTSIIGYTLQVNGSVAGTSAYNNLSDARLKQDVQPIGNALAIVEALRGVTYNWNQAVDPSLKLDDRNHVGFLAQEVEKVLPQAVTTANDARQTKSVAYSEVIPVLNEAIKQQQTQIETLQAENDELKARLDALEAKLGQ